MENFDHINNDLLVKFLVGEASADEQRLVENWLDSQVTNRKFFEHFKIIWEQSKDLSNRQSVNEVAAWKRFQQRIHPGKSDNIIQTRRVYQWPFLRVAAIFILVITGALLGFYFLNNRPVNILAINSQRTSLVDTLPDGSVVILNKHSLINYPEKFTGSSRSITLKGEAFFTISPDKNKPFIIQVNGISIKVVGTSFNVKTTGNNTEVIVETGVVEVSRNNRSITLNPGEKIIVTKTDSLLVKLPVTDKLYNYYRTKQFYCDDTPLWKLIEYLNQAYSSNIVIGRKNVRTLPLTTVFDNKPLDSILVVIGETFNLSVVKSGDSIVLK
ncbi:MAG: FecR domain-containing protein [Chitinophagaceae bacterium]